MKFVLTTSAGLESIAKKEIERQWWTIESVTDRLITFSWDLETMVQVNLWSRVGNKVYILMDEQEQVCDFDSLFDCVKALNWKKYFTKQYPIVIKTASTRSELFSAKTVQSLGKKAVVSSLVWDNFWEENTQLPKLEILLLLIDNTLRVLLDTSGSALHMRGYRTQAGEAPIKESLAAGLVLLSSWKFREAFYDPFCGSGTLPIEAAMIAKNIAPGLNRSFAFEDLWIVDGATVARLRDESAKKEFSGTYTIFGNDIDPEVLEIAKQNANRAWVGADIVFENKDFITEAKTDFTGTLVSNPPYGERLKQDNLRSVYNAIDKFFRENEASGGGMISSYMEFDDIARKDVYKKRKLYNGGELCYFWRKK